MYQTKSGVKNFSPLLRRGPPPPPHIQGWMSLPENLRPGTPPPPSLSKAASAYPKIWDLGPPLPSKAGSAYLKIWDLGPPPVQGWISLSKNLRPRTPPPVNVNRQTPVKTVPSRRTTYAGGNYEAQDTRRKVWPWWTTNYYVLVRRIPAT